MAGRSSAASPSVVIVICAACLPPARWQSSLSEDRRHQSIGHGLLLLLTRRPTKVAAVALANKIARMAWAMMTKGERYREPAALRHETKSRRPAGVV